MPRRRLDLIGRSEVLAGLRRAVRLVADGSGHVASIVAPAGLGKSALLEALADSVPDDTTVLRVEGDELLRDLPFGAVSSALGSSPAGGSGLPAGGPAAGALESVIASVVDRCDAGPVAVLVDDLQWVDPPSLRALAALARRTPHLPLLLVLASRPTDDPAVQAVLRRADPLALGPLADSDARALARRVVANGELSERTLAAVVERAAGSPFWLRKLGEFALAEGAVGDALPRLELVVLAPLRSLGSVGIRTLAAAALGGGHIDVALVARAVGVPEPDVEQTLRAAERLGVTTPSPAWSFTHDLVREALVNDLDPTVRNDLARLMGLTVDADDPVVAVGYLQHVGAADAAVGEVLLRAAASSAMTSIVESASLAERGWRLLGPDHPWHLPLARDVVGLLATAGRANDGFALGVELLTGHLDEAQLRLRVALAACAEHVNRSAEALEVIGPAAAAPDLSGDLAGLVHTWHARALLWVGDLDAASVACDAAMAYAGDHDVVVAATRSLLAGARGDATGSVAHAREAVEELDRRPRRTSPDRLLPDALHDPYGARAILAARLLDVDDIEGAEAEFDGMLGDDRQLTVSRQTTCLLGHAASRYLAGSVDEALVWAHEAVSAGADAGAELAFPLVFGIESIIALQNGDAAGARAARDAGWAAALSPGTNAGIDVLLKADLVLAELDGTVEDALGRVELLWAMAAPMAFLAAWRTMAPAATRIAAAVGHPLAARLAEHARSGAARAPDVPSAVATGLRCTGLERGDAGLLAAAAERYEASPRRLDEAECRIECATVVLDSDRALARHHLHRALELSRELRSPALEERATAMLRRVGVRKRRSVPTATVGWAALTPTEERVVDLVAEGLTNRQIGERLHMGARTVETHLGHVFAKLGLRSRVEVARARAERR